MGSIPGRLHDMDTSEGSILQEVDNIQRVVANYEARAAWSTSFRFLVQGALAIHQLRLLDISRREEVMFLELIEGSGRHVRAHITANAFSTQSMDIGTYTRASFQKALWPDAKNFFFSSKASMLCLVIMS